MDCVIAKVYSGMAISESDPAGLVRDVASSISCFVKAREPHHATVRASFKTEVWVSSVCTGWCGRSSTRHSERDGLHKVLYVPNQRFPDTPII